MISLYYKADSPLHGLPAGIKLTFLVFLGTTLFLYDSLWFVGLTLIGVLILFAVGQIPVRRVVDQLKPALILLVIIFVAQGLINGWEFGLLVVARFAALILAASLVTLTTLTSQMVAAIETVMSPFSRWISVEKISLSLSLAIRFIPVIAVLTHEVREAQRVRGLEKNLFAVATPVVIRTLKMGDQIAEALDARSFDTETSEDVQKG
ncbi:MAG: energy-coupling factor transporter transmembrane protein EcfT [Sneathiella sp.]|nr:energy-coupling factor transporter transmembrane protein EcfT [Sneathiella sp.]